MAFGCIFLVLVLGVGRNGKCTVLKGMHHDHLDKIRRSGILAGCLGALHFCRSRQSKHNFFLLEGWKRKEEEESTPFWANSFKSGRNLTKATNSLSLFSGFTFIS